MIWFDVNNPILILILYIYAYPIPALTHLSIHPFIYDCIHTALARSPQSSGSSTRRGSHNSGNNPHNSPSLDPTHPHHNTHSPTLNGDLSPSINTLPLPINIANTLQKLLPSVTAAGKLSEALHKLRQIDLILEQVSVLSVEKLFLVLAVRELFLVLDCIYFDGLILW